MSFQYLSFQRSPPARLQYGQQVVISPLVTNDLREAKFNPEEGELPIDIAWVRENGARQWTLVKREEQIKWRGEETSWKKVELTAPSREEMRTQEGKSCVRLAMWVANQGRTRRAGQKQNGNSSSGSSRPFKKPRTGSGKDLCEAELLNRLVVDPYEATIRAMRDQEDVFLPVLTPPIMLYGHDGPSAVLNGGQTQKFSEIARLWHIPPSWTHRCQAADDNGASRRYIEVREELGYQLDKVSNHVQPLRRILKHSKRSLTNAHDLNSTSGTLHLP